MLFSFKKLTLQTYLKLKEEIVELYLHSFTTGDLAQYITRGEAEKSLDQLQLHGSGIFSVCSGKLAGIVLGAPLTFDKEFPFQKHSEIPLNKTIYIAELMVHTDARAQGVASGLIQEFFENEKVKECTDAVIRVWDKNLPALSLYRKLGFIDIAEITQTKQKSQTETFEMHKIYLHKKLK